MKKVDVKKAKFEIKPETRMPKKGKAVVCITTGEIFKSAKEAANHYGFSYTAVTECCNGNLLSVGGGKGTKGKGLNFCYVADLAYKVNDITDYIKYLKMQAEHQVQLEVERDRDLAEREARIEAVRVQLMGVIQRYKEEMDSVSAMVS